MALLGFEHFDLYGSNVAELLLAGYVQIGSPSLSTGARTGNRMLAVASAGGGRGLAAPLAQSVDGTIGQGAALRSGNPVTNASRGAQGFTFGTAANLELVRVVITPSLGFAAYIGSTLVGESAGGLITVSSWFWLEAKVIPGDGTGQIIAKMNNTDVVLNLTGLTIAGPFTRVQIGCVANSSGSNSVDYDDWVWWSGTGGDITDFMNDTFLIVGAPTADTAVADWTPSTGSTRYNLIDEDVPDSADYIQSTAVGDACEFTHPAFNLGVGSIAAIASQTRALKSDAGAASYKTGIKSGSASCMSDEIALATGAVVHKHICERNPDGNVLWTQASANAARLRVERAA